MLSKMVTVRVINQSNKSAGNTSGVCAVLGYLVFRLARVVGNLSLDLEPDRRGTASLLDLLGELLRLQTPRPIRIQNGSLFTTAPVDVQHALTRTKNKTHALLAVGVHTTTTDRSFHERLCITLERDWVKYQLSH